MEILDEENTKVNLDNINSTHEELLEDYNANIDLNMLIRDKI